MSIRVIIVDDLAIIRDGLRFLLESQHDIQVVGLAANGRQAVKLVEEFLPDVAVVDISMPELNGIDAIPHMLLCYPRLKVVILSIHGTKPYIVRAVKAGASAYLLKETAGVEVLDAVRAVYRGERYFSQPIADLLWDELFHKLGNTSELNFLDTLSLREREVLQMVAEGKTSLEVAQILSISAKTVDTYRSRLMQKIGVTDITGLVRFAIQQGLIHID